MEKIYPKAGTILVPKPEFIHLFKLGATHIVSQTEVAGNGELGEYWMVKPMEKLNN